MFSYEIDADRSMLRVRLEGRLDEDQFRELGRRLAKDPDLRPGLSLLSDHSGLEAPATTEQVKLAADMIAVLGRHMGPMRCALVVTSTASFGMGRMFEVLTEPSGVEVRAFRTLADAEAWLLGTVTS